MVMQKILIVDDDEAVLKLIESRLKSDGYNVIKAATGKEAVSKTRLYMPHLIIMDIMLPDINGAEAVRQIKEDPETRDIPVIFLSGMVNESDGARQTINAGSRTYLAIGKPVNFDLLQQEIENCLS